MARKLRASVRRMVTSRRSLAAALIVSCLSWACQSADSPTAVRDIRAAKGSRSAAPSAPESRTIPGQYIITFADSVSDVPGLAKKIANEFGSAPMFTYTSALKGFAAKLPERALNGLQHNPQIVSIEEDQQIEASDVQLSPPSWGLDRIDQRLLPRDGAYEYANNGTGVTVYIIDTGIRPTHAEFAGRVVGGFTAISDGRGTADCAGHGTHVAGTVGGRTVGVAKGVTLVAVRVLDCTGNGTGSGVVAGLDWITRNRARPAAANMSLAGVNSSTLNAAVQSVMNAGITVAVAAGNYSADACAYSPANLSGAITVGATSTIFGATGIVDARDGYSNYGSCVDLFAPGTSIVSAWFTSDTATMLSSGTSMATPHVAGAAALYLSTHPSATPSEVAQALKDGATPGILSNVGVGSPNLLLFTGFIGASVPSVTPPSSPADTTTPPATNPAPDKSPTASFVVNCPGSRSKCTFDASGSIDDHGIVSFGWSFGDGTSTTAAGVKVTTHTFARIGTYSVQLTVVDGAGQQAVATRTVQVKKL
jgi:subtilisin family serine protease